MDRWRKISYRETMSYEDEYNDDIAVIKPL